MGGNPSSRPFGRASPGGLAVCSLSAPRGSFGCNIPDLVRQISHLSKHTSQRFVRGLPPRVFRAPSEWDWCQHWPCRGDGVRLHRFPDGAVLALLQRPGCGGGGGGGIVMELYGPGEKNQGPRELISRSLRLQQQRAFRSQSPKLIPRARAVLTTSPSIGTIFGLARASPRGTA